MEISKEEKREVVENALERISSEILELHKVYKNYTLAILNTIKTCAVSDLGDVIKAIEMDVSENRVLEKTPFEDYEERKK